MEKTVSFSVYGRLNIKFKTWHIFLSLTILYLLIYFTLQNLIMTRQVYYSLLGSRMETYRIDDYINFVKKISIWGYLSQPLLLWLKIAVVSFLIQLPLMIRYTDIPFKSIFRVITLANLAAAASATTKIFYLFVLPVESINQRTLDFTPLSVTNFLDKTKYSAASWGFLSSLNLFEVLWILIVYYGLVNICKLKKDDSMLLVLGVWTFIAVFQFALISYISKVL